MLYEVITDVRSKRPVRSPLSSKPAFRPSRATEEDIRVAILRAIAMADKTRTRIMPRAMEPKRSLYAATTFVIVPI